MPKTAPAPVEDALRHYRAKRRFDETAEPEGGAGADGGGNLYIIQKHDATRLHYDFRLELDGVLLSWAVTRGPSYNTKDKRLAVRTEDHPLEYGRFEGTIPKGNYGGGTVMLWDSGSWEPVGDARQGLQDGKIAFLLHGERLRGRWALVRMRADAKAQKSSKTKKTARENWLLIKERDEFANTSLALLEDSMTSVVSGRSMPEIAKAGHDWSPGKAAAKAGKRKLPAFADPMLATLVEVPPDDEGWIYEIKYDGYRALIAADRDQVKIYTRSGLDWTVRFKPVAAAMAKLQLDNVLIDTEIVVIDQNGRTDFGALVAALEAGNGALSCFAFDVLVAAGKDQTAKSLTERQAVLKKLLGAPGKDAVVQRSEVFSGGADHAASLLKTACAHGLEGIIAKRAEAPYRGGRRGDWLKLKCGHGQEFVIIGFSPSHRNRPFASILLAVNGENGLRYAGRVGSGFSNGKLDELAKLRDGLRQKSAPCNDVPAAMARNVVWVKPSLVAQIEFAGWTPDNLIRHGRFTGLRRDKAADEITAEKPGRTRSMVIASKSKRQNPVAAGVPISHEDRVVYPGDGITKGDVAAYLGLAAPLMLPYLKDRFVSFLRCPGGAAEKCFFQRHPAAGFGDLWLEKKFSNKKGQEETYVYCKDGGAVMSAVQMGVLEFHIWGSKVAGIEKPDRLVFDLDPDDTVSFETVKAAAFRLREVLAALDLESLAMLSGGKGIHIVVPIQPQQEWPAVKAFAANLAARIAADDEKRFVASMSKARRTGKIFIDHFRNERGATAVAPYSPRARSGAPVAWPVGWAALRDIPAAKSMTIQTAAAAIMAGENAWSGYGGIKQRLSGAALKAMGVSSPISH